MKTDEVSGQKTAAEEIYEMARRHAVQYVARPVDEWAEHITRLAGDDVRLDQTELLLVALTRAGHISGPAALRLQARYLHEATP